MNKYKKQIEVSIIIALVFILTVFVFRWSMEALIHNKVEIMVPKIEGKSLYEAIGILSKTGMAIAKEADEYNSQLPPGTILRQIPAAGMVVREGKIIKVVVSKGSDLIFVPDVIGKDVKMAELDIRRNQLVSNSNEQMYSVRFEKNKVVSQTPTANAVVEKNTTVSIITSLGSPPEGMVLMPDFVGKDVKEAKSWVEDNKLEYEVKQQEYQVSPDDIVLNQDPAPDTVVVFDTRIILTISQNSSTIPDNAKQENKTNQEMFNYSLPMGSKDQEIRVVLMDSLGEHNIFTKIQSPGSEINIPVIRNGKAKIRVFVDNILIEEREMK